MRLTKLSKLRHYIQFIDLKFVISFKKIGTKLHIAFTTEHSHLRLLTAGHSRLRFNQWQVS